MGFIIKKRQLILALLVVALGVAVFVNWYYNKPETSISGNETVETTKNTVNVKSETSNLGDAQLVNAQKSNEYFTTARLNRSTAHDEALEVLNDIIKDSSSSSEAVASAEKALENISKTIKLETDLENLITAKTGSECIVVLNESKAQAILNENTLNDTVSTQIIDIIASQTNIFSENITLIEAK